MAVEFRRKAFRKAAPWRVVVVNGDMRIPSAIINISESGAMLELEGEMPSRTYVLVLGDKMGSLEARVVWRKGNIVGVCFTDPVAPKTLRPLLKSIAPPEKFGRHRCSPSKQVWRGATSRSV
jgi:hypothetical protein